MPPLMKAHHMGDGSPPQMTAPLVLFEQPPNPAFNRSATTAPSLDSRRPVNGSPLGIKGGRWFFVPVVYAKTSPLKSTALFATYCSVTPTIRHPAGQPFVLSLGQNPGVVWC
jgi:hypothetical protein